MPNWILAFVSAIALIVSVGSALIAEFAVSYQRKQFAQTAFYEYAKFRESPAGSIAACAITLSNESIVSDKELWDLVEGYPRYDQELVYQPLPNFAYSPKRHAALKLCVDETEGDPNKAEKIRSLFNKTVWSAEEGNDEVREVARSISSKVSKHVNFLDVALIGYKHGGGDREVLCENFASYVDSGWKHPAVQHGVLGRFIERLIKVEVVREDNFPSLFAFMEDLRKGTKGRGNITFTKAMDCTLLHSYPGQDLIEWFESRILRLKSV
jgi:hypothetical protein